MKRTRGQTLFDVEEPTLRAYVTQYLSTQCAYDEKDSKYRTLVDVRIFYMSFYFWATYKRDDCLPEHKQKDVIQLAIAISNGKISTVMDGNKVYLCGLQCMANDCNIPMRINKMSLRNTVVFAAKPDELPQVQGQEGCP